MANRKRAGQKASGTRATSPRPTWWKDGKFHGSIEVVPPADGAAIRDGARILLALRSLTFGNVPDPGTNELSLVVAVETDKETEGLATGSLKFDLLKYVEDGQALNIRDLVIFSGPVHRHLTLRCSVDELDAKSVELTKQLITALLNLAKDLVGGGSTKTLLGGLPALLGALLSFNEDDQVLVLNHSFYTGNVRTDERRSLRSGVYTFRKRREPTAKPQVEMQVEVLTVA